MRITDCIVNDIKPVDESEKTGLLQAIFSRTTHTHIPISRDQIYVGCLSENDIYSYDPEEHIHSFMGVYEVFFVRYEDNWLEILEKFAQHDTNIMPVLNEDHTYLGYYELADIMNFFNHTPFLSEPGSIVIIEKGIKDFSFSEICQIIESNDGKILGLFISKIENDLAQISIKITSSYFNDVLAALRRYSYHIISSHQEDTFIKDLRERSAYLEKYLNI